MRQNTRALKRIFQRRPISQHHLVTPPWDDPVVVRELAFDQLGSKRVGTNSRPQVVITKYQCDGCLNIIQQACKFENTLARHNHLARITDTGGQLCVGHGQPVTIRCHHTQMLCIYFQQQTIQVIADVLLRHSKRSCIQHVAKISLRHLKPETLAIILNIRKMLSWQGRQGKVTGAATQVQPVAFEVELDWRFVPQSPTNIRQFAGRYGDTPRLINMHWHDPSHQFHFHIGAGQGERVVLGHQ